MIRIKFPRRKTEKINKEFQSEILNGIRRLNILLNDFIENNLEKEKLDDVINSEKKADRLKEEYIELLFRKKYALPFIVSDRYNLINLLDTIMNKGEIVARMLKAFPYRMLKNIKDEFNLLNQALIKIIETLIDSTTLIETDFENTREKIYEIEAIRREAHGLKFKILTKLYEKLEEDNRMVFFIELISLTYDIISRAEEIGDFLRGLIIKYPSK